MLEKRIFSIDISDGHEVIHTHYEPNFTQSQRDAIRYICAHVGVQAPAPVIPPNPVTMTDADWVRLGRRLDGRETDAPVVAIDLLRCNSEQDVRDLIATNVDRGLRTWAHLQGQTEPPALSLGGNVLGRVHHDGEPGQEVAVPLPDDRSIPVTTRVTGPGPDYDKYALTKVVAPPLDAGTKRLAARQQGFTGDICTNCHGSSMKRNGSCLSCADCGSTTGCS